MTAEPAEDQRELGRDLEDRLQDHEDDPTGHERARRHGAADARDAAEVGEREHRERLRAAEVELVDAAEAVADERARDAGDERRQARTR